MPLLCVPTFPRRASEHPNLDILLCDLSRMADVKRAAEELKAKHDRLDVLVNNAGATFKKPTIGPDGLELTFASPEAASLKGEYISKRRPATPQPHQAVLLRLDALVCDRGAQHVTQQRLPRRGMVRTGARRCVQGEAIERSAQRLVVRERARRGRREPAEPLRAGGRLSAGARRVARRGGRRNESRRLHGYLRSGLLDQETGIHTRRRLATEETGCWEQRSRS
ncbi:MULTISPECIES: SDR family NAD(P)-dependent oxidoreductase [Sorangium]|uniref:SDR family NAD(P)-dependent oxidoreductase n=1 Tax=Sorangium TaxID=39643 RepID=UPI003D9C6036